VEERFGVNEYLVKAKFIYREDTGTHAQGTDPRVALGVFHIHIYIYIYTHTHLDILSS